MINASTSERICVVGAGHAGGSFAALLRQQGYQGSVTLVGSEAYPPYQRPPLSKAWLKGEADAEGLALKAVEFYSENNIDLQLGQCANAIDREARQLVLDDGSRLDYDKLVLATGAEPIRPPLPGIALAGIHVLRSIDDAQKLKSNLGPGRKLAVVGGGYIGLEVAASARALGAEVVVFERENRLLARVACSVLSDFFQAFHEDKGVEFVLGAAVSAFASRDGHVSGVELDMGKVIACDVVVVGVGARPNVSLAEAAGLVVDGGIVVDLAARTSDQDIYAIGDVTRRPMPLYDRHFRMESVPNALEQSRQAVASILNEPPPVGEVPWQWSDQYDLKLQIAGYAFDADEIILRGKPSESRFSLFHLKQGRVQSVEAVNAPGDFMMGKKFIAHQCVVETSKLANVQIPLKQLLSLD